MEAQDSSGKNTALKYLLSTQTFLAVSGTLIIGMILQTPTCLIPSLPFGSLFKWTSLQKLFLMTRHK